ncbi:hypothetical protein JYU34_017340 [Plutella xylostella]|uniref:Uncharacterized protein n=1 Tax=Plutella xylostella TaxID=51655 RepID=A0ABQ7Q4R1_PLUXY|nr:hypothetical protein JYU34_017340 [Plutella xylostella]
MAVRTSLLTEKRKEVLWNILEGFRRVVAWAGNSTTVGVVDQPTGAEFPLLVARFNVQETVFEDPRWKK